MTKPTAWMVNDKVFKDYDDAVKYKQLFSHHKIIPLYRS